MSETMRRVYVQPGETVTIELPHSEVCMHMRVAGKRMAVRLQQSVYLNGAPAPGHVAQIIGESGREFSAPILTSEAGFYRDGERFYTYLPGRHLQLVSAA